MVVDGKRACFVIWMFLLSIHGAKCRKPVDYIFFALGCCWRQWQRHIVRSMGPEFCRASGGLHAVCVQFTIAGWKVSVPLQTHSMTLQFPIYIFLCWKISCILKLFRNKFVFQVFFFKKNILNKFSFKFFLNENLFKMFLKKKTWKTKNKIFLFLFFIIFPVTGPSRRTSWSSTGKPGQNGRCRLRRRWARVPLGLYHSFGTRSIQSLSKSVTPQRIITAVVAGMFFFANGLNKRARQPFHFPNSVSKRHPKSKPLHMNFLEDTQSNNTFFKHLITWISIFFNFKMHTFLWRPLLQFHQFLPAYVSCAATPVTYHSIPVARPSPAAPPDRSVLYVCVP